VSLRQHTDSIFMVVWAVFAVFAFIAQLTGATDQGFTIGGIALCLSLLYEIRGEVRKAAR